MKKFTTLLLPLLLAACATQTTPFPSYNVAPLKSAGATVVHGTVQSFNLNSTGRAEGLLLRSPDQVRQINFPEALASTLATSLTVGEAIDAVVAPVVTATANAPGPADAGPATAPAAVESVPLTVSVYRLVSLRDSKGRMYALPSPRHDPFVHVQGAIKGINSDESGVISSIMLNTGDLVSFASRFGEHDLAIGMPFAAAGYAVPSPTGGLFVEAEEVNGLTLRVIMPPGMLRQGEEGDESAMEGDYGTYFGE